jgi:uridine phosphorylase
MDVSTDAMVYAPSELILNEDGSVYHLRLRPEDLADTIVMVGDPERVPQVSKYFDKIELEVSSREFVTHTGYIGKKRITCISHGIGCDNIDIVLNELDALAAIDLEHRTNAEHPRVLDMVRIGTTGSLHPDLPVDSWVASSWAIGLDGLLNYYPYEQSPAQKAMLEAFLAHTGLSSELARPYTFKATDSLISKFTDRCFPGITLTAPGFYAPQGRMLRMGVKFDQLNDKYSTFHHAGEVVTNFEMETSAIYGLGTLGGHRVTTVCAVIANRLRKEYSKNAHTSVDGLIKFVLERLTHE